MAKPILIIGAFDTKGPEYAFLREQILNRGHTVLTMNTGILGTTDLFPVDFEADAIVGDLLMELRQQRDRGRAMAVMAERAPVLVKKLYDEGRVSGIIGMGGGGGTSVITSAMRSLPLGVPKLCVST